MTKSGQKTGVYKRFLKKENFFQLYQFHNGMITDFSVLQEAPFTDKGSIVDVFMDMSVWLKIKSVIDSINHNAVA